MGRGRLRGVPVVALLGFGAAILGCSLDSSGTGASGAEPDASVDAAEVSVDVGPEAPGDTCIPEAGSACNSPALCFTGTVECDGRCNAPPDPPSFGAACTTSTGCGGKVDCDGKCVGDATSGADCTTLNGCTGKRSCDGTCVGDPPNFGKACATPKGCTAKYDCAGVCPENTLVAKACKTMNGCDRKTDCLGKCNEDPSYGKSSKTTNGCTKTLGCDLKCPADDSKVGTTCTVNGCSSTYDCSLKCNVAAGAGAPCVSATCGVATTRDCAGVCPDPKPGDPSVSCGECPCPGGKVPVYPDVCGRCPSCSTFACPGGSTDAGTGTKDGGALFDGGMVVDGG